MGVRDEETQNAASPRTPYSPVTTRWYRRRTGHQRGSRRTIPQQSRESKSSASSFSNWKNSTGLTPPWGKDHAKVGSLANPAYNVKTSRGAKTCEAAAPVNGSATPGHNRCRSTHLGRAAGPKARGRHRGRIVLRRKATGTDVYGETAHPAAPSFRDFRVPPRCRPRRRSCLQTAGIQPGG